ncbi:hypothetical protein BBJ28_00001783 [Nothophytophthora sp. Chile5]|nr:hypothetical protein BBJ28_00001783 [Nothophytophthora sp. Chile5]
MANGSGRQSDAGALKMKHVKRIHEDDGNQGEGGEGSDVQPMDARVMQMVLESMGADKFEPRVVAQLQEFTIDPDDVRLAIASRMNHYYAQVPSREVGSDAKCSELLLYILVHLLLLSDLLSIHCDWLGSSCERQLMMELADKRNSIPLPPISNEYGVRLPPIQHQMVTKESDRQEPVRSRSLSAWCKTPSTPRAGDGFTFGAAAGSESARPPVHPHAEGSRNKKFARSPIPINIK